MVQHGHPVPTMVHPAGRAKISDGKSVVVAVPAALLTSGIEAGRFVLIDGWFGAAFQRIAPASPTGTLVTLNLEQAEYEAHSAQVVATPAFTAGGHIFWDAATARLTPVATGNRLVGRVVSVLTGNVPRFILYDQVHLLTRATAQADIAAAPTMADFNALLGRLRAAGVIAT